MDEIETGYKILAADEELQEINSEAAQRRKDVLEIEAEIKENMAKLHLKFVDDVFNHLGYQHRLTGDDVSRLVQQLKTLIRQSSK